MADGQAHVLCGACPDEPETYVCGSPREDEAEIRDQDVGDPDYTPCVVCFGADAVKCNACGHSLRVTAYREDVKR